MHRTSLLSRGSVCAGGIALSTAAASGQIFATMTPAGLDTLMGTPLLAVPADGMTVGTVYGHPPAMTPGIPLPTPIGDMGFGPSHERLTAGGPMSSGAFLALAGPGPIAGSTVYAPAGANAIDFFISSAGPAHSFEVTAVGSLTTTTIILPAVVAPTYVGFGAFGETIDLISIVKLPFPSPTTVTWMVDDIRILPAPGAAAALMAGALGIGLGRRRRSPTGGVARRTHRSLPDRCASTCRRAFSGTIVCISSG